MKIYTRRGDEGQTDLFGGPRVGKDHPRVEAYGAVDELNAFIGFAAAASGQDDLRALCQELSLPFVTPLEGFVAGELEALYHVPLDPHPSAAGYELMARQLDLLLQAQPELLR